MQGGPFCPHDLSSRREGACTPHGLASVTVCVCACAYVMQRAEGYRLLGVLEPQVGRVPALQVPLVSGRVQPSYHAYRNNTCCFVTPSRQN